MVELSGEQLRELQMIELELLSEVNRICEKHGIKYCIIAGTMLGACRHNGFIPWDDDADVGMLRDEYEKFRNACITELDTSEYYFQDYRNTEGYRWGYAKLRKRNTIFLRENQEHMTYPQGVFIDIFPMDGIPDNYGFRTIHNFVCFCIRKVLWSEVGKYHEKNTVKRILYKLVNKIPEKTIKKLLYKFELASNKKKTEYVRMLMFPSPNKVYGYKREWYENLGLVCFEGVNLYGTTKAEEYLAFTYGDYMKLPPEKDRKVHPVSEIKLTEVIKCKH